MNKITGAKNLTEKEVENIGKMAAAGMPIRTIAEITGWGEGVIGRIKNGSYYTHKEKVKKEYYEKCARTAPTVTLESVPPLDSVQVLQNINSLLCEIDRKLGALCSELGILENAEAE